MHGRGNLNTVVPSVIRAKADGRGGAVVTVIVDRSALVLAPGSRLFVSDRGDTAGGIHPALDEMIRMEALESLNKGRSYAQSYRYHGNQLTPVRQPDGDLELFFEVLTRRPHLVIVGAGHIAVPLAQLAAVLDFEVTVLDDRPEYASGERFPDAENVIVGPYRETLASLTMDRDTYVVLVTRGHVHDQACLEVIIESPAPYIGMIGSKRRVRTVLRHLAEEGRDRERLRAVRAPIGLDIGSQTPAEIALAIMAEIVNVRRGGRAPSLALGERLGV